MLARSAAEGQEVSAPGCSRRPGTPTAALIGHGNVAEIAFAETVSPWRVCSAPAGSWPGLSTMRVALQATLLLAAVALTCAGPTLLLLLPPPLALPLVLPPGSRRIYSGIAAQLLVPHLALAPPLLPPAPAVAPSTSAPGGLQPAQTPQFVIISHDDSIKEDTHNMLVSLTDGKTANGCPVTLTLFITRPNTANSESSRTCSGCSRSGSACSSRALETGTWDPLACTYQTSHRCLQNATSRWTFMTAALRSLTTLWGTR